MRSILAVLTMALVCLPAQAKVEIKDVEASYGQLGPQRKKSEFVPGDVVYVRFSVHGVQTDDDGKVNGELSFRVINAKDESVAKGATPIKQVLALGGNSFPAFVTVNLPVDFSPGKYQLAVEFTDVSAKQSASFQHQFIVSPMEFALVDLRFAHDEQGRSPAPVGGIVNQTLFIRFRAVGFDRSKGTIDMDMSVQVFDADGKPLVPRPIRVAVHNDNPETVKNAITANFNAQFTLNRPGDFHLKITVTDTISNQTARFEAPLRVRTP